jgi:hypothetical protein
MDDSRNTAAALLARVQPGFEVYDATGERLGTVRSVAFGTADPDDARQQAREAIAEVQAATTTPADRPGTGDIAVVGGGGLSGDGGHPIGPLTAATPDDDDDGPRRGVAQGTLGSFRPGGDRPDDAQSKLARTGFIQIDSAGLFAADRYATPDQIAAIEAGAVRLRVPAGQLLTAD